MGGLIALTIFIFVVIGALLIKAGKEMGAISIPFFIFMISVICFEVGSLIAGIVFLVIAIVALVVVLAYFHTEKTKEDDPNSIYIGKAQFIKEENGYHYIYNGRKLDEYHSKLFYEGTFKKESFNNWIIAFGLSYSQMASPSSHLNINRIRRIADRDYKGRIVFSHESYEVCNQIEAIILTSKEGDFLLPLYSRRTNAPDDPEAFLKGLVDKVNKLCE